MNYKEAVQKLVMAGVPEKNAKNLVTWYQISGFLIPSNVVSLILSLIGIKYSSVIPLAIAVICMMLATKYVSDNVNNIEMLRSRVKVLKVICIILLVIWALTVIGNIIFAVLLT